MPASGDSFTGLAVLRALIDDKISFNAYIAIDPSWWWDDYATERAARAARATRRFARVQLFMASSGEDYPTSYFIDARGFQSLARMLTEMHPAGLDWTTKRYADESHHSMPLLAVYDGLSYLFAHEVKQTGVFGSRPRQWGDWQAKVRRAGGAIV